MDNSILQTGVLMALPAEPENPIPSCELFKRLGVANPTPSQRASLARSLARLAARGLVHRYNPQLCRQGRGSLWVKA